MYGYEYLHAASLLGLFILILLLSKIINDFLTPYRVDDELTQKDNTALSVSICGYLLATGIIYVGAFLGPSKGILRDLVAVGGYSLLGVVLLNIARVVNDKLILYKFQNIKEIIQDRNAGTGAVQFGSYVASGLIIAGAVHGQGGGVGTTLVFFLLGQVALILFGHVYNFTTAYDIHAEIEKDNVAAGVAFGGSMVAVGIILMKGSAGNFVNWRENLITFGLDAVLIFVLLPAVRFFFDKLFMPRADLCKEIQQDQNLGAGFLETTLAIGFATVLFFTMS